jgi:penicillin-binding protein activator
MTNFVLSNWFQPRRALIGATVCVAMMVIGCGGETVTKVNDVNDPNGGGLTSAAIDPQDFNAAGSKMVASLLSSGALNNSPHTPAIMAMSRISDKTALIIDTDLLTKNIRISLLNSGKVQVTTVVGLNDKGEDALAQGEHQKNEFMNDAAAVQPDYSLSGKIIEEYTQVNGQSQHTYTFQLSLTDIRTGTAVWEDQRQVGKVSNRQDVGF